MQELDYVKTIIKSILFTLDSIDKIEQNNINNKFIILNVNRWQFNEVDSTLSIQWLHKTVVVLSMMNWWIYLWVVKFNSHNLNQPWIANLSRMFISVSFHPGGLSFPSANDFTCGMKPIGMPAYSLSF